MNEFHWRAGFHGLSSSGRLTTEVEEVEGRRYDNAIAHGMGNEINPSSRSHVKKEKAMEHPRSLRERDERLARAWCSLEGLSVGDAFGERFFHQPDETANRLATHLLAPPPWPYTDDTQMALSIVSILRQHGAID
jgi:hypothetical protein